MNAVQEAGINLIAGLTVSGSPAEGNPVTDETTGEVGPAEEEADPRGSLSDDEQFFYLSNSEQGN